MTVALRVLLEILKKQINRPQNYFLGVKANTPDSDENAV